jgi:hypothetical protein
MKIQVEWKDGDAWKQTYVELRSSRKGNIFFTLNDLAYVLHDLKNGSEVVVKSGSGWTKAGRVVRGTVFLGPGKSYSESMEELAEKNPLWTKPTISA